MKQIILVFLIILVLCVSNAAADRLFIAKTERFYKITGSAIIERKPFFFESFNLRNVAGRWYLLQEEYERELTTVKENDEVAVLQQKVFFSGFRNFVVYFKSHKFSIAEMAYSAFPEKTLKDLEIEEDISVWYGSFKIK